MLRDGVRAMGLTQSISSKSLDSITKLLTIPVPAAAFKNTSTLPKKMYLLEMMVRASPAEVMINSAPSSPYVISVPDSSENSELAPWVKSTVVVLPKAASLGHAMKKSIFYRL